MAVSGSISPLFCAPEILSQGAGHRIIATEERDPPLKQEGV